MRFFAFVTLLFSSLVSANSMVDLNIDGISYKIESQSYSDVELSLNKVAKALTSCTPAHIVYNDVVVNRPNSYVIKKAGNSCNVIVVRDLNWVYNCNLNKVETNALIGSIDKRIKTRSLLGDFTSTEQSIFFNQKKCAVTEL